MAAIRSAGYAVTDDLEEAPVDARVVHAIDRGVVETADVDHRDLRRVGHSVGSLARRPFQRRLSGDKRLDPERAIDLAW